MKKTVIPILAIAAAIALAIAIQAQDETGCCCNKATLEGSFQTQEVCEDLGFFYAGPPETGQTCSDLCESEPWKEVPPPPDCDNPAYKPPVDVTVSPVRGRKHLKLNFVIECPANYLEISRCKGSDCTDFKQIQQIAPATVFTDDDKNLLWNTDYSYRVTANYEISGEDSQEAIAIGNAGDLECWHKQDTTAFCIWNEYYEIFQQYLEKKGYAGTDKYEFRADFSKAISNEFSEKFNKAWFCNENNVLSAEGTECTGNAFCVADENGAFCIEPGPCEPGGATFGLYYSVPGCEGSSINPKYCFFDRSKTSVDKCFACNKQMTCADYRTQDSCERDNCHAGDCEWNDVYSGIGIGVCIDKRFSNCIYCTAKGTPNMENAEAHNEVFDQCTKEKAEALSTQDYACIFDGQKGKSCDAVACMDYNQQQCGSPTGGIQLNPDNSLLTRSADWCSIEVCEWMDAIGCVKNHEGNDEPDCKDAADRKKCELDYFTPDTDLLKIGSQTKTDWILIKIFDRQNKTEPVQERQGKKGYKVKLCLETTENACDNVSRFEKIATMDRLNLNDLKLQEWQTVLFELEEGQNTLHYFAADPSKNPEIIESISFPACNFCQGPKILNVSVTPGRQVNGKWYSYSELPAIKATFNERSTLTNAMLVKGTDVVPISAIPGSGSNYEFEFVPTRPITDGQYTLTFNAKDENNIEMDAPGTVEIVIDTTPGDLAFDPADGTVINETEANISVSSTEEMIVFNFTLEEHKYLNAYAVEKNIIDLLPDAETEDNITYETRVVELTGGKKVISVIAEDFAGNPIAGQSRFWVSKGPLIIRLAEPSWGVSDSSPFDIVVETTRPALCKFLFDVPTPPPVETFEFMQPFDTGKGVLHTLSGFDKISAGDPNKHNFFVYCREEDTVIYEKFLLGVDATAPNILKAYAQPETVIERLIPGRDIFKTALMAETDDLTFCKYSANEVPFVRMEGKFSSYELVPKRSNSANINVTQDNTEYTYYAACKNEAELASGTVPIKFKVDTSQPFQAVSKTPRYSNETEFNLRIETNKRAFCYYGTTTTAESFECMNACANYGLSHIQAVSVNESGTYNWYVKCSTGAAGETTNLVNVTVTVDTTPPYMLYVNDNSTLEEYPEISYFPDQLRVSFLGADDETPIVSYSYMIKSAFANESVLNWTNTTQTNGTAFYVTGLNLVDGATYKFYVKAKNIVELVSEEMASNGVTINTSMIPDHCQNGVQDEDETDVDCGGECAGCLEGGKCEQNTDCISGYCKDGICTAATCNDDVKNGKETDVDCGGPNCPACSGGKDCAEDDDCETGLVCENGKCTTPDFCSDGELSGNEGDIDCGGSCPTKCQEGQNCNDDFDCEAGLVCIENTCSKGRGDSDRDGVPDDKDKCPNTPSDELADEDGCSPSQKFSCDDEIDDSWRIRYFGSVLCDGDGAADADPDDDGLTNLEEYRHGTNPLEPDTDFDGWSDKEEIDRGYDPKDPESHPASKLRIFLIILLILLLIAGLAVGGYYGYQWYIEKHRPKPPKPAPRPAPRPVPARKLPPEAIEKLRGFAAKPEKEEHDWLTLKELSEKMPKKAGPEAFEKLQALISGKIPRREIGKVMKEIRKEPDAFELMRKISYEKLSPAEKEKVKEMFELLKKGKLGEKEIEALLAKLRVTAEWYEKNREKLEKELEEWTQKPAVKKETAKPQVMVSKPEKEIKKPSKEIAKPKAGKEITKPEKKKTKKQAPKKKAKKTDKKKTKKKAKK